MQNEKTVEQLTREYEANMPPEILALINSFDWKKILRTIVMQNQVMMDVASDLEQSVYLMLLGVVSVQDVFERLVEDHEFSEDKAKKVLEEIESGIFNPLYKQLSQTEDYKQAKSSIEKVQVTREESRDAILAEIEKEEPVVIAKTNPAASQEPAITIDQTAEPVVDKKPEPSIAINKPIIESPGVAKPFSLNTEKTMVMEDIKLPVIDANKGIVEDPISSGLSKATIVAPIDQKPVEKSPARPAGAPDPYREPIE